MAVQDDLATLFAKNLTLSHQQQPPPAAPEDPNKIVYISQHYTHSAHVHPTPNPSVVVGGGPGPESPVPRPASEPADLAALDLLLRSAGVDTSALSLSQAELFRRADDAQRARLVELWTIGPQYLSSSSSLSGAAADSNPSLAWGATSLEQEEMLARLRYEAVVAAEARQQHQQQHQQQQQQTPAVQPVRDAEVVMSLDGTEVDAGLCNSPSSVQSSDSRWQPAAHAHGYMEPYMQSGYEELARREYDASARKAALDPVYKSTGGVLDWERQQWMENQYGSFVGGWRDDEDML